VSVENVVLEDENEIEPEGENRETPKSEESVRSVTSLTTSEVGHDKRRRRREEEEKE